jgi:hypothetical protein
VDTSIVRQLESKLVHGDAQLPCGVLVVAAAAAAALVVAVVN